MEFIKINERCKCTLFTAIDGASEYSAVIESNQGDTFADELVQLLEDVTVMQKQFGLDEDTLVFARFYLSDIANQREELQTSKLYQSCNSCAHSIIQQSPLCAGRISLLLYFVKGDTVGREPVSVGDNEWRNGIKLCCENYTQYWTGNYAGLKVFDSYKQTDEIFRSYNTFLDQLGVTLYDNVVRTWIYVRDIDNHYAGMVEARKEFFDLHGLTKDTHYIASTGIEARLKDTDTLVSMDALAVDGIVPEQVVQMEALENLNPTHEYGVTFERGTKVIYGDREHYYISGTASIDKKGDVVYLGDVEKQAHRTIDNIEALLTPHGACLEDMAYLIVYLRNITQVGRVEQILRERVGHDIPLVVVQGAVCRPTWLIEIEGVAIRAVNTSFPIFA